MSFDLSLAKKAQSNERWASVLDAALIGPPTRAMARLSPGGRARARQASFLTVTPRRRKNRLIIEVSALTPLGRKAIAEGLKRDIRFLGPNGFQKVPVRAPSSWNFWAGERSKTWFATH
jgi:hypothetical protein